VGEEEGCGHGITTRESGRSAKEEKEEREEEKGDAHAVDLLLLCLLDLLNRLLLVGFPAGTKEGMEVKGQLRE
jgi:hypothetical protein